MQSSSYTQPAGGNFDSSRQPSTKWDEVTNAQTLDIDSTTPDLLMLMSSSIGQVTTWSVASNL